MEFLAANLIPLKNQNQKILEEPPIKSKNLFTNTKFNICLGWKNPTWRGGKKGGGIGYFWFQEAVAFQVNSEGTYRRFCALERGEEPPAD